MDVTFQGLKIAKDNNMITILDPSPNKIIPEKFYDYVDIITPNEIEAEYLSGISITSLEEAKQSAEYISSLGPKNVIITLADQGSWVQSEDFIGHIKPYKVDAVASVAAGDAFNGAFAAALCENKNVKESIEFANKFASLLFINISSVISKAVICLLNPTSLSGLIKIPLSSGPRCFIRSDITIRCDSSTF